MNILLLMLIYMAFFFLTYKLFYGLRSRKDENVLYNMIEMRYLEEKYRLDIKKIGVKKLLNIVCLVNGIIFAITLVSTTLIENLMIRLVVMFVLLFPLIFISYYLIGKHYQKKGKIKDV